MEAALQSEFGASGPVEGIPTAGRTDRAITEDLFAYYGLRPNAAEHERFLAAYFAHLPLHLKTGPAAVLPGVHDVLEALAGRSDVLLGLLTGNFERSARLKLEHFGLHNYFVLGGYGDLHHDRDDVARIAVAAAHGHLGRTVPGDRLWVIGDTPSDVRCGRAVGAKVVAVSTGLYSHQALAACSPDHLFEDFAQPQGLLSLFQAIVES